MEPRSQNPVDDLEFIGFGQLFQVTTGEENEMLGYLKCITEQIIHYKKLY